MNITPTNAAIGICSIMFEPKRIKHNKDIEATIPDKRPLPPEFTFIID